MIASLAITTLVVFLIAAIIIIKNERRCSEYYKSLFNKLSEENSKYKNLLFESSKLSDKILNKNKNLKISNEALRNLIINLNKEIMEIKLEEEGLSIKDIADDSLDSLELFSYRILLRSIYIQIASEENADPHLMGIGILIGSILSEFDRDWMKDISEANYKAIKGDPSMLYDIIKTNSEELTLTFPHKNNNLLN